ncbi:hypothetical protein SERLA73DRAFT_179994 [Serpula lacrymans var. lacrymans S7.3]|uniref:Uncharacterized protein n=2 Tax=Serpula lacrymans var. lacrymans TaxID=341189 RepID=F8PV91_SERL3|nr:uncharacterized protein SERLADRAFT_465389 [Serpula lacrymans var. lacrymans S7.9]EGN99783.1 hypothetical protein SERLA73DRAFT_179994 [Serpula lacrymans var. lacrymans S7.3]EGO25357.1 hypothetical protein SERLADRAFT_465389 [Serpula lacrymans var. lacrymans S7.9]
MDASTSTALDPTPSAILQAAADSTQSDTVPAHHGSPVVAFIIGLAIILLASILNAAGLNLTKLDHVRTSAIPKASRRRDWLRPLWLLGMLLYILSQLIGSTLALDYMRAEYVAPLGSTSLIFNFLFARFLIGTPVTHTDIYGTLIVVLGVIGIVAFGAINSGLSDETNVDHLTSLWRRGGWLSFFFCMAFALIFVLIFTSSLDAVLASRSDLSSQPFSGLSARRSFPPASTFLGKLKTVWDRTMLWVKEKLEAWTAPKDEKQLAWTLGIGWACCGGGLAGGCLVFAKATVKLLTGSLSHENPGNQFGHAAPIFTIVLLVITAVLQIICLNRGLKVYDSTLVVPVFYGVYTATGFLDSLIFNNQVDAYKPWILFLIFVSMMILISGVVLLTHKKPERSNRTSGGPVLASVPARKKAKAVTKADRKAGHDEENEDDDDDDDEGRALRSGEEGETDEQGDLWQVGDASDDEEDSHPMRSQTHLPRGVTGTSSSRTGEEGLNLIQSNDADSHGDHELRRSTSSDATITRHHASGSREAFRDDPDEFGDWNDGGKKFH